MRNGIIFQKGISKLKFQILFRFEKFSFLKELSFELELKLNLEFKQFDKLNTVE